MSDKIQELVEGREAADHEGPLNISPKDVPKDSFKTQNEAEADHEEPLTKTYEQTYLCCIEDGGKGISWADHSSESGLSTPLAPCLPEPPSYLEHSKPHLLPAHELNLRSPPILHLETHHIQARADEKGKGRMPMAEIEAEDIIREGDQESFFEGPNEHGGGLTLAEKDEQSRRDAELSFLLLAQELLEQGVPQDQVASYAFQTQLLSMSPQTPPASAFPIHSPMSPSRHCVETKPDLDRIAQLTIDGAATRRLPPAYGPHYSPEPSTSQVGSPILAVRRLSVSSTISSASTPSASSAAHSSSYTLEEEGELVAKMQQVLDERYEANKAALLCDLDKQANKRQKLEQAKHRWDTWRHRFGLGLAGGIDEKWAIRDPQHHDRSSLSFPFDPPDEVRFLPAARSRGYQHDKGSAGHTAQGLIARGGPDQSPISPQGTGTSGAYTSRD